MNTIQLKNYKPFEVYFDGTSYVVIDVLYDTVGENFKFINHFADEDEAFDYAEKLNNDEEEQREADTHLSFLD